MNITAANTKADIIDAAMEITDYQQAKINQLTLNLGFYERLIQLSIRPRDVYKFWRRPRALQAYWS